MHCFVTGGAGFIGSNLVGILLEKGEEVTVYDNLSLGREEHIEPYRANPDFNFIKADLLDLDTLKKSIGGAEMIYHLAANSDISYGAKYTDYDLKQGTIATYNVLEAMRLNEIKEIVFSSTSAIYGEAGRIELAENYGPLLPISFYGASKLAAEGYVSAFCENYDMRAWIYRFANIVGDNATHGAVFDFVQKLIKNPTRLEILGDGKQAKPYLYVKECAEALIYGYKNASDRVNVFNLGCPGATTVTRIAEIVCEEMGLENAELCYTGGDRGWVGDVPQVRFDVSKINKLGWSAKYSSDEAVRQAARAIVQQAGKG